LASYRTAIGPYSGFFGGICSTAVGYCAGNRVGCVSVAIGTFSGSNLGGSANVAIGFGTGCTPTANTGGGNTLVGAYAGKFTSGNYNVAIGHLSGNDEILAGSCNVAIGPYVGMPTPGGDCQLVIGFGSVPAQWWLTGNSTGAIKPEHGIIDCAGSCGTACQILMSDGANAVCWGGGLSATCVIGGSTVVICNGLIVSVI
jgi:hypothetical protein